MNPFVVLAIAVCLSTVDISASGTQKATPPRYPTVLRSSSESLLGSYRNKPGREVDSNAAASLPTSPLQLKKQNANEDVYHISMVIKEPPQDMRHDGTPRPAPKCLDSTLTNASAGDKAVVASGVAPPNASAGDKVAVASGDTPPRRPLLPSPSYSENLDRQKKAQKTHTSQFKAPKEGEIYGDFKLTRLLDEAPQSAVFVGKAIKAETNYDVESLAMLKIANILSLEGKALNKEIIILKELDHPNIIKPLSALYDETIVVLITKLYKQGSLSNYMGLIGGVLSEDQARAIFRPIVSALNTLRHLGYAHRDIKPDNILIKIDNQGQPVPILVNFGMAYHAKFGKALANPNSRCGSYGFQAPEIQSDVPIPSVFALDPFSLAATILTALIGRPFDGPTNVLGYVKNRLPLEKLWSDKLKAFLTKLARKDPKTRMTMAQAENDPWLLMEEKPVVSGSVGK